VQCIIALVNSTSIDMDKSNGYEGVAKRFIETRGRAVNGVGVLSVRCWAKTLPRRATVLDLGCGTGIPISKVLADEGLTVYGIDASVSMIRAFIQNFPSANVACESVEDSPFFNREFDAIVSWGLMFLLSADAQVTVIQKVARALRPGGKLLFTAPAQETGWRDVMTGQYSRSLGAEKYKALLSASGLHVVEEFGDEGDNHYYNAIKI
jgi:2-polyprenyl-3-methyl-5-hydroxy-6-metoxy-1,4-benzoquinol methylase